MNKAYFCPECHNKTLYRVDSTDDLCICDECGAEVSKNRINNENFKKPTEGRYTLIEGDRRQTIGTIETLEDGHYVNMGWDWQYDEYVTLHPQTTDLIVYLQYDPMLKKETFHANQVYCNLEGVGEDGQFAIAHASWYDYTIAQIVLNGGTTTLNNIGLVRIKLNNGWVAKKKDTTSYDGKPFVHYWIEKV